MTTEDRMRTQRNEFDAVLELVNAYNGLAPIVDDDYPETRYRYESALVELLKAMEANKRFAEKGNRYGLVVAIQS